MHTSLASQSLSEGNPYKLLKRALSAASKKWTFQIDDGGGMFDCSPEGIRMEGEGLQSSCRFAVAYLNMSTAILKRASGKDVGASSER